MEAIVILLVIVVALGLALVAGVDSRIDDVGRRRRYLG